MKKSSPSSLSLSLGFLFAVGAVGCTMPTPEEDHSASDTARTTLALKGAGDLPAPGDLVTDLYGRSWRVSALSTTGASKFRDTSFDATSNKSLQEAVNTPVPSLDDGELLGLRVADGLVYSELTPSKRAIDAKRSAEQAPQRRHGSRGAADNAGLLPTLDGEGTRVAGTSTLFYGGSFILGTDDRTWVTSSQYYSWPYASQIRIGGCSAVLIGQRTALSAAHCFYDREASPPGWWPDVLTKTWYSGRVRRLTSLSPFVVTNWTAHTGTTGCYTVTIPTAFTTATTSTAARREDFAVIEFTCNIGPGAVTGWQGVGIVGDYSRYSSPSNLVVGYDSDSTPPQPLPILPYFTPSMIRRSGGPSMVAVNGTYTELLSTTFDAAGGSSGAGIAQQIFAPDGDYEQYVTGTLIGPSGGTELQFRRITSGSWGFIAGQTTEW